MAHLADIAEVADITEVINRSRFRLHSFSYRTIVACAIYHACHLPKPSSSLHSEDLQLRFSIVLGLSVAMFLYEFENGRALEAVFITNSGQRICVPGFQPSPITASEGPVRAPGSGSEGSTRGVFGRMPNGAFSVRIPREDERFDVFRDAHKAAACTCCIPSNLTLLPLTKLPSIRPTPTSIRRLSRLASMDERSEVVDGFFASLMRLSFFCKEKVLARVMIPDSFLSIGLHPDIMAMHAQVRKI